MKIIIMRRKFNKKSNKKKKKNSNKKWENSHHEDTTIVVTKQKEIGILDFLRKTWRDVFMSEIKLEWVIDLISKCALLINYLRQLTSADYQ